MRILGIDPSLTCTGWAIVEDGKVMKPIDQCKTVGTIKTTEKTHGTFENRINQIGIALLNRLTRLNLWFGTECGGLIVDKIAIEDVFVNRRNMKTSIQLAKLHGAILRSLFLRFSGTDCVSIYSPALVKVTITGSGNASKEQVLKMVRLQSGYKGKQLDESDAIAVALTCEREISNPISQHKELP